MLPSLATLGHATGVRIIRWADRDWQHAGLRRSHLVLGGSGGGLRGGSGAGKSENDNECADSEFHNVPLGKNSFCKSLKKLIFAAGGELSVPGPFHRRSDHPADKPGLGACWSSTRPPCAGWRRRRSVLWQLRR